MAINDNYGSVDELVNALAGPVRYRVEDLALGLEHEKTRLGIRPYLVALWRSEFDMDGLTDYLTLIDSHETVEDAIRTADEEADRLLRNYTNPLEPPEKPDVGRWAWVPSRDSNPLYLPKPSKSSGASEKYRKAFALKGGYLETMYCSLYVLGPFTGDVVGDELVQLFKKSRYELWSYMTEVGEAARTGKLTGSKESTDPKIA
jgi:hypothetical protein